MNGRYTEKVIYNIDPNEPPMTPDEIRRAFQEMFGLFDNEQELKKLNSKKVFTPGSFNLKSPEDLLFLSFDCSTFERIMNYFREVVRCSP